MLWRSVLLTIPLMAGPAVFARDADTLEELAVVRDFEVVQIDRQTVRIAGDEARVDVRVTWRDPAQRPPDAAASRVIRYILKCKDQTTGVAAVTTIDQNGKMIKRFVTPPGSWDFVGPKPGSYEQRWLKEVCP
ncbi:MAG TPA: surface-adhesin E family protein [Burkholderiales bacterium]|nr:surface-adhesin E family protein [Burkholderiales bacterium]